MSEVSRSVAFLVVVAALATLPAGDVWSADKASLSLPESALTAEEKAEREGRKACKVAICAAFHNRKPDGGDIACEVIKSWRKSQLEKIASKAKVSWPWGRVKCTAHVQLKRQTLIKAMTQETYEAKLDRHQVSCEVEREKAEAQKIEFDFAPTVKFEKGRAANAAMNWGNVEAPTVIKGALWTATATDNTLNVLSGMLTDDINDFIGRKCKDVQAEWAGQ